MIDDDITQSNLNLDMSNAKEEKAKNPDEIYTKEENITEPKPKTNPAKYIALVAGCLIIVLLCCCCSSFLFLPSEFLSQTTIDDMCAILKTEGQTDPFGICEKPTSTQEKGLN